MRVLFVASITKGKISPFVAEQLKFVKANGCDVDFFGIKGGGIAGYLKSFKPLKKRLKEYKPDVIHAHFGLSGLFSNLQRKVPVVTTYHGSDIHAGGCLLKLSKLSIKLSAFNIFVSSKIKKMANYKGNKSAIIPCGVDLSVIKSVERVCARESLKRDKDAKYILFASAFDNKIKNAPLAQEAVNLLENVPLVELKNYNREEVNLLMNGANALIMTSLGEGSPQVIKEAMACGTPIVSVDVGDVKEVIAGVDGCFIADREAKDIAEKLKKAIAFEGKTKGRERILELGLDNNQVAERLIKVYNEAISS